MVCFAACVIVSFEKRGKRTNEKDRILVFFGLVIIIIGKNGVSAFFVVVLFCEFITPSSYKKQNSCPTRRHLHIYSSPSHRQTDTRQFRTRSVRAKTVPQLAKRSNHLSHRARQKERKKENLVKKR